MTMCDRFENVDVTEQIKTGDWVTVEPDKGVVFVESN